MCFKQRKGVWHAIGIAAMLMLPAGCIPIPVPWYERPPLWSEPETLGFLKVGETTKEEILWRFGTPPVMRADGRVWVYGEKQVRGIVFLPGGPMSEKLHLFAIEFDREERLHSLGVFEERHGCLDSGLCLDTRWRLVPPDVSRLQSADFFAAPPAAWSDVAGHFELPSAGCRVHFYSKRSAPRAVTYLWQLSEAAPELQRWWLINGPYFVVAEVAPGDYRVTMSTDAQALADPSSALRKIDDSLHFTCAEPALVFVQREVHSGLFETEHRLRMRPTEKAIQDLRHYKLVEQPEDLGWVSGPYGSIQQGRLP
jgi:hypothetical protein